MEFIPFLNYIILPLKTEKDLKSPKIIFRLPNSLPLYDFLK